MMGGPQDEPELYLHPFALYCQKVLVALYERGIPFRPRMIDLGDPQDRAALVALWPLARFPVLRDGDLVVAESTTIIEHLDLTRPGPPPLTREGADGIRVRFLDRVFDNWVSLRQQEVVNDALLPEADHSPSRVARGRADLDTVYGWLDRDLGEPWAAGDAFTLADCAAAPALFYADWVHPIPGGRARLRAYLARLLARPSVARVVEEARPFRHLHPVQPGPAGRPAA